MPPDVRNTSIANGAVRKNFADKKQVTGVNTVRTEFVVKNTLAYLLDGEFALQCMAAQNSKENEVMEAFKTVVDMVKKTYASPMAELSASLDVCPDSLTSVILGVSNELFCEGISWSKIATFFVFISILTIQCLRKNFPQYIVQETVKTSLKFVQGSLEKWILDHKGWEGMIDFSRGYETEAHSRQQNTHNSTKNDSWAKSAFYGTFRFLSTVAHFAMYSDGMDV